MTTLALMEEAHREVNALKEQLAAEKSSGKRWEEDMVAVCGALGIEVTPETVDGAANLALAKIYALKHVAREVAAYGDCDCDLQNDPEHFCLYCTACNVAKELPAPKFDDMPDPYYWRTENENKI